MIIKGFRPADCPCGQRRGLYEVTPPLQAVLRSLDARKMTLPVEKLIKKRPD